MIEAIQTFGAIIGVSAFCGLCAHAISEKWRK
jgi:hypothetical protein